MPKVKLIFTLVLLALLTVSAIAYACIWQNFGFEIYATNTHAWHITLGNVPVGSTKAFNVTVECEQKSGEFLVTYHFEIHGPQGLRNDFLRVQWQDTDGHAFIIGKDGDHAFSGTGTLRWNSPNVDFVAGHKNDITLTLTFLTTEAMGKYNSEMWVAFTKKPSRPR